MAKIEQISKKYTRSVKANGQLWTFTTELSASVEINSKEDLINESAKLFAQTRALTEADLKKVETETPE